MACELYEELQVRDIDARACEQSVYKMFGLTYHVCGAWVALGAQDRFPLPAATFVSSLGAFKITMEVIEALRFTSSGIFISRVAMLCTIADCFSTPKPQTPC